MHAAPRRHNSAAKTYRNLHRCVARDKGLLSRPLARKTASRTRTTGPFHCVIVGIGRAQAEAALSAYIRANPDADAFFTVTPNVDDYGVTLKALLEKGIGGGKAALVTFDLTPNVLASIKAGDTLAAIDQQPYLQGYLPAILARQYLDVGLMPGGDILTGPSVVNADNIDQVLAGTKLGRR